MLHTSTFKSRLPGAGRALFLLLLVASGACKRSHPPSPHKVVRRDLTLRFRNVVASAGGAQVWIKHPNRWRPAQGPSPSLQVLATRSAYQAVIAAVRQEVDRNHLQLQTLTTHGASALNAANLSVTQRGQRVIQINLREVPRLLRAAIVIDDMGHDWEAARKLLALDYPLTFSVLPYLRYTQMTARQAHQSGHEVMLHLPMEPERDARVSPGRGAILVGMNMADVQKVVANDLASVPYAAGVNNHMGSRATRDEVLMEEVMKVLAHHGLYFIDSRTTAETLALDTARREGVPAFYRAVFLDDIETVPYTLGQLQRLRQRVQEEGVALAIGHPHATTIAALAKFLPQFEQADIELVVPSQIVRLPELARLHPPAGRQLKPLAD